MKEPVFNTSLSEEELAENFTEADLFEEIKEGLLEAIELSKKEKREDSVMEWNVFYHDVNARKIRAFNIFNHYRFSNNVEKALKKYDSKDEFAKELESELMYNFWCKAEYEIVISPWCGGKDTADIKVDIYTQVMNNWNVFLDYVWSHKRVGRKKA